MKVTGYQIREALQKAELQRNAVCIQVAKGYTYFPEEGIIPTDQAANLHKLEEVEEKIARLQTLQQLYNSKVLVPFEGNKITLAHTLKLVGGLGRTEKAWRKAFGTKPDHWCERGERSADVVSAKSTLSIERAMKGASEVSSKAFQLRAGIAKANTKEVNLGSLTWGLLEKENPS